MPDDLFRKLSEGMKRLAHKVLRRYAYESLPSYPYLSGLMKRYQTKDLVSIDRESFEKKIRGFSEITDSAMEGFEDPEKQRDLSIRFCWGHDHDFGDFRVEGKLGTQHLTHLAYFIDRMKALPKNLDGLRVLDIGCWTGATSLLLCAMGAHVVAVEEVKKYTDCLEYLKYAFDIRNLEIKNLSLFNCTGPDFQDAFDIVLYAGVLYHVTDPVLSLRIVFDCLKDGGTGLVETATIHTGKKLILYEGPNVFGEGKAKDLSRSGWNWFIPSPKTVLHMMADVGFKEVKVGRPVGNRVHAVGKKTAHVDMLRAGLSSPHIR